MTSRPSAFSQFISSSTQGTRQPSEVHGTSWPLCRSTNVSDLTDKGRPGNLAPPG
eukprot:CAMPEP_0179034398 /NCGR_PEP_ID=MMETSP0796-20121207/12588_1 /TAXON_ID=73915 /ORGANISM="Pyrodinium bahamense, Strain pbaha01" /LENGTH=54 /DNA_ID=CAMNT_0020730665 /DNA_START=741 /DNA_END=905 /DNA_ORIENTATION=+